MPKPETHPPLKPLVFDVLLVLHEADCHGYAIAKALQECGQQVLPGNLYRTLNGMVDRGLIEKSPRRDGGGDEDERRRYFRITTFGCELARAEAERLQDRVAVARAQRLLSGSRAR